MEPFARIVTVHDLGNKVSVKEYSVLELPVLRPGQILDCETIAKHVWDEHFVPFSNVIDVYVKRLRKKIAQSGP